MFAARDSRRRVVATLGMLGSEEAVLNSESATQRFLDSTNGLEMRRQAHISIQQLDEAGLLNLTRTILDKVSDPALSEEARKASLKVLGYIPLQRVPHEEILLLYLNQFGNPSENQIDGLLALGKSIAPYLNRQTDQNVLIEAWANVIGGLGEPGQEKLTENIKEMVELVGAAYETPYAPRKEDIPMPQQGGQLSDEARVELVKQLSRQGLNSRKITSRIKSTNPHVTFRQVDADIASLKAAGEFTPEEDKERHFQWRQEKIGSLVDDGLFFEDIGEQFDVTYGTIQAEVTALGRARRRETKLTDRQERLKQLLTENPRLTQKVLAEMFDVTQGTISRDLAALRARGELNT